MIHFVPCDWKFNYSKVITKRMYQTNTNASVYIYEIFNKHTYTYHRLGPISMVMNKSL